MYFSKIYSAQAKLFGANPVDVEVDISNGLHSIVIVGLGDKAVEEARDRVSAAIKNSGFIAPKQKNHKVVISLAPADLKKSGTNFDVPIAIAYLSAAREITVETGGRLFVGELSLDGKLRPVFGILPIVLFAKENNFKEVFVPMDNLAETKIISDIIVYGAKTLREVIDHISGKEKIIATNKNFSEKTGPDIEFISNKNSLTKNSAAPKPENIFDEIIGAEIAKRGLIIAASGKHNISFYGPPGTGKTMLAKSLSEIIPPLNPHEIQECTCIYSLNDRLTNIIEKPPVRSPHHTSSYVSIIGGGNNLQCGEITLAHNGILFLDEFPEFDRRVIDSLRQPLEEKTITISRTSGKETFPANFILASSMNPCPCGYHKTGIRPCLCTQNSIKNYQRKISGPIIDRIDLWIEVSKIDYKKLSRTHNVRCDNQISSEIAKNIIIKAREIQLNRCGKLNNELNQKEIKIFCQINEKTKKILELSAKKLNLSVRSYFKILKIARTIADIDGSEKIKEPHILEALQYRQKNS